MKKVIFQCWPVDQGLVSREADACSTLSAPVLGSKACQQLVKHVSSGRGVEAARKKGAGVAGFNETRGPLYRGSPSSSVGTQSGSDGRPIAT